MKKNTIKTDIIIVIVLVLAAAAVILVRSAHKKQDSKALSAAQNGTAMTPADYNGRKIGILTGSAFEKLTEEHFPDSEYSYYNNVSDMAEALGKGKIDGYLGDEPVARMMSAELSEIGYFKKPIANDDYCFGFQKNSERADTLREQFNEMLTKLWSDGTMDEIQEKMVRQR
ncbi:MAG: transporter substrate-binding domain-containing protein [Ruminococcus sp.]|nr:transporter substrate-binding domain-containing protein [Ruminococcus sp.]